MDGYSIFLGLTGGAFAGGIIGHWIGGGGALMARVRALESRVAGLEDASGMFFNSGATLEGRIKKLEARAELQGDKS